MITDKVLYSLQFDKILSSISDYAVLSYTKREIPSIKPLEHINGVEYLLNQTQEAYNLLYFSRSKKR